MELNQISYSDWQEHQRELIATKLLTFLIMVSKLLERPIAHRGLHSNNADIPENSMAAFQKAIDLNYAIELDIHLLADNEVVVFHDGTLERMCGIDKNIHEMTSKQVSKIRLLNSDHKIPLLPDILNMVNGKVPILIELKNKNKVGDLEKAALKYLANYKGDFAIQSFNPISLGWFAKNAPEIARGQLSSDFKSEKMNFVQKFLLKGMYLNFISKPNFIAYDSSAMPDEKIYKLREMGLPILCWTIRTKEEYIRVKKMCDNIIFESFIPN